MCGRKSEAVQLLLSSSDWMLKDLVAVEVVGKGRCVFVASSKES